MSTEGHDLLIDDTEPIRRERMAKLISEPQDRDYLEAKYGQVWTKEELDQYFDCIGFMAPYMVVRRKIDGVKGSFEFTSTYPRLYFNWTEYQP